MLKEPHHGTDEKLFPKRENAPVSVAAGAFPFLISNF